jgi:hypothetical protein
MRKIIVMASVVAMVALVGGLWAQGDVPPQPPAGQNMRGGPEAGGKGGPRPDMNPMQFLDMMMMHAAAPWAVADAEAQQLLDKVIAARKQLMKGEQDRLAAYEKFVAAARGADKDATEAARKSLQEVSEGMRENMKALHENVKALGDKLRAIRPEGVGQGDRPNKGDARGDGKGAGKGDGQRQPPAKKDGM